MEDALSNASSLFCESSRPSPRGAFLAVQNFVLAWIGSIATLARMSTAISANIHECVQLFRNLNQHRVKALVQTSRKHLTGKPPFQNFLPAAQLHNRLHAVGGFCRD